MYFIYTLQVQFCLDLGKSGISGKRIRSGIRITDLASHQALELIPPESAKNIIPFDFVPKYRVKFKYLLGWVI